MKKNKLILGAAGYRDSDAVTVDIDPQYQPHVLHDLNITPWPFRDNQFKEIVCHHVIEHLRDLAPVMKELHRICHPQGKIYIEVPHYSSCFAHSPGHAMQFSYFSLDGYIEGSLRTWRKVEFKFSLIRRCITFHRAYRRYHLHRIINIFPRAYERFWAYIIPAENLIFELRPIKD